MKFVGFVGPKSGPVRALGLAAAVMAGLLVGIEPAGGDPDRMYRPLKAELARTMAEGASPFWSDRLGVGYPLAAESHAAAFYAPNQVLYRLLSVPTAYRLSMFGHYLLMAGATYAYARRLKLGPDGAALAAVSFTFCGFQSIHSSHEWAYHALAYLPLCLLLVEGIMAGAGLVGAAALGAAFGLQLTVGHFQVQSWTAGLVAATAIWRAVESPRAARRVPLAFAGLAWGAAMAAVQLGPTWELARFVGYDDRNVLELAFYGFPPAHWAEVVVPTWLRGIPGGPEANYWYAQGSTGYEACFYVGTIPLIFAFVGLLRKPDAGSRFWVGVAILTFALAGLPSFSLPAFQWVASLPGMGLFRAPGRFLALTSLGLALLAGKGLDRAGGRGMAWAGLALAIAFAAGGMAWVVAWSWRPDHVRELGGDRLLIRLGIAAGSWLVAAALAAGWLRGRVPAAALLAATALELGGLYYTSTTDWGWAVAVPESSPILKRLAEEPGDGKVAGMLSDIPLRIGRAPLLPYTGFPPPPPHPLFAGTDRRPEGVPGGLLDARLLRVQRLFGVTHGVWDVPILSPDVEVLAETPDATLDRIASRPAGSGPHSKWRLVRFKQVDPPAVAAGRAVYLPASAEAGLPLRNAGVVRYFTKTPPPPDLRPNAARAEVASWDGRTAVVEHDGPCDVVIRRTYYPGWTYRVDDGPEHPVLRAEDGVQSAHVPGAGRHRVTFAYRPTQIGTFAAISLASTVLALAALARPAFPRRSPPAEQDAERQDDGAG